MFELLRRLPLPPGLGAMDARLGLLRFFLFTAKTLLSNATIYTSKENSQRSCTQITHCMRFNSLLLYVLGICGSHIPTHFFLQKGRMNSPKWGDFELKFDGVGKGGET